MRIQIVSALAGLVVTAGVAGAQGHTARLEGTVIDSARGRPLAGATVLVTKNAPEPGAWYSVTTDARGHYQLDTLAAGRYSAALWHPVLDSLELTLAPRSIEIRDGEHASLDLALPSGATLRASACPGVILQPGYGVLQGQVLDADSEQPLAGAVVAVHWSDLAVNSVTLQVEGSNHDEGARTNVEGRYRICGLPTGEWLVVQVQRGDRGGTVVRTTIPDSLGVSVLNMAYNAEVAISLAAPDSTPSAPPAARVLTGTSSVSGTVLGEAGQPLAGAQLRVLETAAIARTDATGRFSLAGLPAGTQILEAKRVGYRIVQQPVQLARGREITANVQLNRIVSLDSVLVVARRSRYREFERDRRYGFGKFFTEEDIARRNAFQTTDLLRTTNGFRISGSGFDAKVYSSRSGFSLSGRACETNIVVDGMQHQDINWVQPSDIGAMEVFAGPAGAPVQYDNACGVVVIWTKR